MDEKTLALRLALAALLGGVLGLEREVRGQDAGLRTHILVCLGACCFTLASIFIEVPLADSAPRTGRGATSAASPARWWWASASWARASSCAMAAR